MPSRARFSRVSKSIAPPPIEPPPTWNAPPVGMSVAVMKDRPIEPASPAAKPVPSAIALTAAKAVTRTGLPVPACTTVSSPM